MAGWVHQAIQLALDRRDQAERADRAIQAAFDSRDQAIQAAFPLPLRDSQREWPGHPYGGLGLFKKSGKGGGPGAGQGQRGQQVFIWPAWRTSGTNVYCSSRWYGVTWQIYDVYWTPKTIKHWWESKTYDWVWVQELPYNIRREEFIWSESVNRTAKSLKKQRWLQKVRHDMSKKKRGQ